MSPQQRRKMSLYERTLEKFARMPVGDWYMKQIAPRLDPPLLRLTGGRVSSVYPVPVMLLTTTGAKTGLPRTLPLLYLDDGDATHPDRVELRQDVPPGVVPQPRRQPEGRGAGGQEAAGHTRRPRSPTPLSATGPGTSRSTCTPATATTRAGGRSDDPAWSACRGLAG